MLRDIDTFISGINDHIKVMDLPDEPWTRNDVFAVNALKGQFVGQGGGDEARRTQFLGGPHRHPRRPAGLSVFNDLRQFKNPGTPTSVDGKFKYGHLPKRRRGNAIIDPGSFEPTPAADVASAAAAADHDPTEASNTLMITGERSTTGSPADGRRPADRLLLSRPHVRDRHERAGAAVARRDHGAVPRLPADRARRRLRHDADLRRAATSSTSSPSACAAEATRCTATRASAARWSTSTPARSTESRSTS